MNPIFNIFETPWLIIIIAVLSWVVITLVSMFRGMQKNYHKLLIPLLLGAVAFPVDLLVKTDYEKIDHAIKVLTASAINMTPENIEPFISENYSDIKHKSKSRLLIFYKSTFSEPNIQKVNRSYFNIAVDENKATCQMNLVIRLNPESPYAAFANIMSVEINAFFAKNKDKQWLLTGSELISVNNTPMSWKQAP